jgi:hypothetical protein
VPVPYLDRKKGSSKSKTHASTCLGDVRGAAEECEYPEVTGESLAACRRRVFGRPRRAVVQSLRPQYSVVPLR